MSWNVFVYIIPLSYTLWKDVPIFRFRCLTGFCILFDVTTILVLPALIQETQQILYSNNICNCEIMLSHFLILSRLVLCQIFNDSSTHFISTLQFLIYLTILLGIVHHDQLVHSHGLVWISHLLLTKILTILSLHHPFYSTLIRLLVSAYNLYVIWTNYCASWNVWLGFLR